MPGEGPTTAVGPSPRAHPGVPMARSSSYSSESTMRVGTSACRDERAPGVPPHGSHGPDSPDRYGVRPAGPEGPDGYGVRPDAEVPAFTAHEQLAGTSTTTATGSGGRPLRLPLADPTTLVSMPATVAVLVTTENEAVARVFPGHWTWYPSVHGPMMWNDRVLAGPWPEALNCALGATGTMAVPAATRTGEPAAGPGVPRSGVPEPDPRASRAPAPKHPATASDAATAVTAPDGVPSRCRDRGPWACAGRVARRGPEFPACPGPVPE